MAVRPPCFIIGRTAKPPRRRRLVNSTLDGTYAPSAPLPRLARRDRLWLRYPLAMKVAEILRLLQQDGWYQAAQKGSHRQFKHESKPGRVTVPGKPSDDLALGTQNSILKQARLK